MADFGRGIIAGLVATIVVSVLMVMRLAAGIMTWFHPVEVMNLSVQSLLGVPHSAMFGWLTHFIVGTFIWGGLFGLVAGYLPGQRYSARGLVFGVVAWLLVMIILFPAAGSGFFGTGFGMIVPASTLISHLIYGAVLGAAFGWLRTL